MNNDLISRGALLVDLREKGFLPAIVQRAIEHAPASDSIDPVRCKDCIGRSCWGKDDNGCDICWMSGMYVHGEDDFCSYGKRKEGADNGNTE